jgi:hypothetical protein
MSEPPPDVSGIPTPTEAAKDALTAGAKDMAQDAVMRRIRRFMRQKLPRPLYDFLFRGRSAGDVAKDEARRRIRNLIWGCSFTLVFGALVSAVLAFVVVVVGVAVFTSM